MANAKDFLKKNYWVFLLILIFVSALYIRCIPGPKFKYPQMLEIDSHFFMRMGEYIIENGTMPEHDIIAGWGSVPGGPNRNAGSIITPWVYPIFYFMLHPLFGISLYWVAIWIPAFLGAVQVLLMYFLGKELFNNRKIGLLSATFVAFAPGILYRVSAGFMEKEPVVGVFIILGLYFFVRSFKGNEVVKGASWKYVLLRPLAILDRMKLNEERIKELKAVTYGILSGIFFALALGSASLVRIPMLIIGMFVIFSLLLNIRPRVLLYAHVPMFITYAILSNPFFTFNLTNIENAVNLAAIAFLLIRYAIERLHLIKEAYLPYVVPAFFCVGMIGLGIASYVYVDVGAWTGDIITRVTHPMTVGVIPSTVAESQEVGDFIKGTTFSFGNEYAITTFQLPSFLVFFSAIYFSVLGIALMCYEFVFRRKRDFEYLLIVTMFFSFLVLSIGAARLAFLFPFAEAIAAGYFIVKGGGYILESGKKYAKGRGQLYVKITGIVLVFIIVFTNFAASWVMANNITTSLTDDWLESFNWLRENTPADSVLLEWWDFGWWYQYVAKKITLVDGGYHNQEPTQDIALFYTTPLSDTHLNFLKNYSVTYVMVSSDLIPKFGAMSKIANWGEKVDVLPVFQLTKNYQEGNKVLLEYGGPDQSVLVAYSVTTEGNATALQNITALIKMSQGQAYVKSVGIGNQVITTNRPNYIPGMVYFAGNAVIYLPEAVQDCVFARLYLFDGAGMEQYFERIYDKMGIKIYEVKYENFPANITGHYINAADR